MPAPEGSTKIVRHAVVESIVPGPGGSTKVQIKAQGRQFPDTFSVFDPGFLATFERAAAQGQLVDCQALKGSQYWDLQWVTISNGEAESSYAPAEVQPRPFNPQPPYSPPSQYSPPQQQPPFERPATYATPSQQPQPSQLPQPYAPQTGAPGGLSREELIVRQWAAGRAVELLASGLVVVEPLDPSCDMPLLAALVGELASTIRGAAGIPDGR